MDLISRISRIGSSLIVELFLRMISPEILISSGSVRFEDFGNEQASADSGSHIT